MASEAHLTSGQRLAVFSIREGKTGPVWIRAGSAWVNRDGSVNVYLDVLPLEGKLHLRDPHQGDPTTSVKVTPPNPKPELL